MRRLTTASVISHNVYLGNSADALNSNIEYVNAEGKITTKGFDVVIEAKDLAEVASAAVLKDADTFSERRWNGERFHLVVFDHGMRDVWTSGPLSLGIPIKSYSTSFSLSVIGSGCDRLPFAEWDFTI